MRKDIKDSLRLFGEMGLLALYFGVGFGLMLVIHYGTLWFLGDTHLIRIIVAPIAFVLGFFLIPGWTVMAIEKVRKWREK